MKSIRYFVGQVVVNQRKCKFNRKLYKIFQFRSKVSSYSFYAYFKTLQTLITRTYQSTKCRHKMEKCYIRYCDRSAVCRIQCKTFQNQQYLLIKTQLNIQFKLDRSFYSFFKTLQTLIMYEGRFFFQPPIGHKKKHQ